MGNIYELNKSLDEVLAYYYEGFSVEDSIRLVKEKGYEDSYHTNPSIHYKTYTDIIAQDEDIENEQVIDKLTGQVKRDLI